MKVPILQALRQSNGYVSGELLSKELNVSRVSIWKHIRGLKEQGYRIETTRQGYKLVSSPDLLLPYEFPDLEQRIYYFPQLGSTMDAARELAKKGASEGTIVLAEAQTKGRGRLGRQWLSPRGGIYFTLILRPRISPLHAPRLNLAASVAVATAIRKLLGLRAELKWPNDVLIKGKKVCGILAEIDAEMDIINFINLGIGINVNTPITGLEKTATSLKEELGREVSRKELLVALLKELEAWQAKIMEQDLLERWKSLSATLNRQVKIIASGEVIEGLAVDIDDTGALIVRGKDGSLKKALAGDCVHLREMRPDNW